MVYRRIAVPLFALLALFVFPSSAPAETMVMAVPVAQASSLFQGAPGLQTESSDTWLRRPEWAALLASPLWEAPTDPAGPTGDPFANASRGEGAKTAILMAFILGGLIKFLGSKTLRRFAFDIYFPDRY